MFDTLYCDGDVVVYMKQYVGTHRMPLFLRVSYTRYIDSVVRYRMTRSAANNLSVFPCDTVYRARDYATITMTVIATIIMALITVTSIIIS